MFSWGYWGWGTSTPQFVKLVDAIEESRGFKPPIFVDTRIKRQVRAPGFNGDAFEKLLGKDRYVHMKELGNRSIVTHKDFIEIADPKAANDLLDMAIQAEKKNRRIIFFCACKQPKCNGEITCHRAVVTNLLLGAARKRKIHITVVEWPGGKCQSLEMPVSKTDFQKVVNIAMSVPLPKAVSPVEMEGPPLVSLATFTNGSDSIHRLVGPVQWKKGAWHLPTMVAFYDPSSTKAEYLKEQKRIMRSNGWEARES